MSNEIVVADKKATPAPYFNWTDDQIKLIQDTVAKGSTPDEFKMFLYVCNKTGLDPFAKQLHMIKRWDSTLGRQVATVQTGIDGYRVIAERSGQYGGVDEIKYQYDGNRILSATATVYRIIAGQRIPFVATAFFDEYIQTTKEGAPTKFWAKMPHGQIAKCAEALALRKAFPNDLSGIYTHEEMAQADNVIDVAPEKTENKVVDSTELRKKLSIYDSGMCYACGDRHIMKGTPIVFVDGKWIAESCYKKHTTALQKQADGIPDAPEPENDAPPPSDDDAPANNIADEIDNEIERTNARAELRNSIKGLYPKTKTHRDLLEKAKRAVQDENISTKNLKLFLEEIKLAMDAPKKHHSDDDLPF